MEKNNQPVVSIVIATLNNWGFLKNCLASLFKNTLIPFEIIISDGGSTDETPKEMTSFKHKNLTYINIGSDLGPCVKRNIGAKKAHGRYLLFLDSDTTVGENFLKGTVNYLDKHQDVGAGQLKILRMDKKNVYDSAGEKITSFGFLTERAQGAIDTGQFDTVENIFSGKTAALIVRKSIFLQIGGFDENYYMYWEEPDLCWRIWKSEHKVVFLPFDKVWHAYGTSRKIISTKKTAQITYIGCRNQIFTIVKNATGRNLFKILVATVLSWIGLTVLFIIKFNFSKTKAITRAFSWNFVHLPLLLKTRATNKNLFRKNFYSDKYWLPTVTQRRSPAWYLGKGIAYISGKPF